MCVYVYVYRECVSYYSTCTVGLLHSFDEFTRSKQLPCFTKGAEFFLFHDLLPKYCKWDINAGTHWKESFVENLRRDILLPLSV